MCRCKLLVLALLLSSAAHADTIDATVTTLLAGHAEPRDGQLYTVVPAYQSLTLVGDLKPPLGIGFDEVRFNLSGWGMVAFGDPGDGKSATGDLDLAFVEARLLKRLTVKLGRMFIVGGAARVTQLDGLSADLKLGGGAGITAYTGAPVTPRFGTSRGDFAVGGRLYWRYSVQTEIGASVINVLGAGRIAREDAAIDGRWSPLRTLALTGYGLWSIAELRLGEANVAANFSPIPQLQISADYRRVAPDLFLPLNSIFSVFSQETRDEAGGLVFARPIPRLRLYGDYHVISDATGIGQRGGGKITWTIGSSESTTVGAEGRVLHLPTNGYWQARLFATQRLPGNLVVTLDADTYFLDQAINGERLSFTGAATVGWDFAPGWRTVVTAIGDVTPFFENRFEVMAKLVYNHTFRFRKVTP